MDWNNNNYVARKVVGEIPNYMMKFEPLFAGAGSLKTIEARENRNLPVQWTVENAPPPQLQVIKEQGDFNRARFDLHIYVERNPKFYTLNVCFFVWLFTQGTGVVFAPAGKLTTADKKVDCLLTLLLATVAYKIILASWLPVKPYLTKLDRYVFSCLLFQALVILYVVYEDFLDEWVQSILSHDNLLSKYGCNFGALWVYGIFFLAHVCLAVVIEFDFRFLRRESWEDVYRKKFVWPPGTSLKPSIRGKPDERAGKPEE